MTYKLGVLGGMGTLASLVFYEKLYKNTRAKKDQDHIDAVILNHASLPDRTREILEKRGEFLKEVREDYEIFNSVGVDYIAITCNTSHYFLEEMKKMTRAEIINMPLEALKEAAKRGKDITFFGTLGSIEGRVYKRYENELGLKINYPDKKDQDTLMDIIYRVKSDGKRHFSEFDKLLEKYGKDTTVITGCTELSVLDYKDAVDAMDVLVGVCLRKCGKL